jgi:hypothetical protein
MIRVRVQRCVVCGGAARGRFRLDPQSESVPLCSMECVTRYTASPESARHEPEPPPSEEVPRDRFTAS